MPAPVIESFAIDPVREREAWLGLRRHDVTASVAGALFGVHPFITAYGLWLEKTGQVADAVQESKPMRRGRLLEPVAIEVLREERPRWKIEPGRLYYREPAARLGATPDVIAHDEQGRKGVVQLKSVEGGAFNRKWRIERGIIEPPLWIAVQALVEARLAGAEWAAVAPLVVSHGIELPVIDIPLVPQMMQRLLGLAADFWAMIADGRKPDPDYARDARLIEDAYLPSGESVDLSGDNRIAEIVAEKGRLAAQATLAATRLREIKAEMLVKLGGAARGLLADGRSITATRVHRGQFTVKATDYVDLRIREGGA